MMLRPLRAALAACLALGAAPALAISLVTHNDFETGGVQGWSGGASNPTPPAVVDDGGPAGTGDAYLRVVSSGVGAAGSRLVAIAGAEWAGNYLAAGVTGIAMDLRNLGSTDLSLRLLLTGPVPGSALSAAAVSLPAGSGWTHVVFATVPGALSGADAGAAALADVAQLRVFHAAAAAFPGEPIAAELGLDNISAVPEPAGAWMLAAGLAALGLRRARRAA